MYEQSPSIKGTLASNYFASAPDVNTADIRFVEQIDYKGQEVCALVVPRHNAQGILCGETLFALSEDGKTIVAESHKKRTNTHEGFYMMQRGDGDRLIIADKTTLLDAKILAVRYPTATVVLANPELYAALQTHLSSQGLMPTKVMVLGHSVARDRQRLVAEQAKIFHSQGASLTLMDVGDNSLVKLNVAALEKSALKMSFEKTISKKNTECMRNELTSYERFKALIKDHPVLGEYEQNAKNCKQTLTGLRREKLEKLLLTQAKEITSEKKLMASLRRVNPEFAKNLEERIMRAIKKDRGINR